MKIFSKKKEAYSLLIYNYNSVKQLEVPQKDQSYLR